MGLKVKTSGLDPENEARIKELKREVARKAHNANRRLKNIEKNKLTETGAYKKWIDEGAVKFGVRGKDYNELQAESARIDNFDKAKTSSIPGIRTVLKNLADSVGISGTGSLPALYARTNAFFVLANRVQDYLNAISGQGYALGYQKVWDVVSNYVKDNEIELESSADEIESMISDLIDLTQAEYYQEALSLVSDEFDVLKGM